MTNSAIFIDGDAIAKSGGIVFAIVDSAIACADSIVANYSTVAQIGDITVSFDVKFGSAQAIFGQCDVNAVAFDSGI